MERFKEIDNGPKLTKLENDCLKVVPESLERLAKNEGPNRGRMKFP